MNITLPNEWAPREYQKPFWAYAQRAIRECEHRGWRGIGPRACLVWHRRSGKDMNAMHFTATQVMRRVGAYWHVFPSQKQGRKIAWEGKDRTGRSFLDSFPSEMRIRQREDEMCLWFPAPAGHSQGSIYQVCGVENVDSLMGSNPVGVIFSEYALPGADFERAWNLIRPILSENGGWAIFIFTPRGRNHGFRLWQAAQKQQAEKGSWFAQLLTVDDTGAVPLEVIQADRDAGMPEELIQQEYYCFPAGTLVHTALGQRPIESIEAGDVVLTHAGRWRKVTRTIERENAEPLLEIESFGEVGRPLRCTPGHPIRVYEPGTQTYRWKPAVEIKPGEFLVMPRLKPSSPILPDYLAALIGWYVPEGSISKTAVQFSFHEKEFWYAAEIIEAARRFGANTGVTDIPENRARSVQVRSSRLADFLAVHCGSGAHSKRIPHDLISGHERLVFDRLMAGDGCQAEIRGSKHWSYTTVSHDLARDVQLLASTLGMRAGITRRGPRTSFLDGRMIRGGPSYSVQIRDVPSRKAFGARLRPGKHGVGAYVRAVRELPAPDRVYNLSVAFDESYVAEGRVVHNCSFEAPLVGTYYGDQIAEMHRAEPPRIGNVPHEARLPVDTFWDLGIGDDTVVLCHQQVGTESRLFDLVEGRGQAIDWYVRQLLNERPYVYRRHYVPFDAESRSLQTGKTLVHQLRKLGLRNVIVVPRTPFQHGIQATRAFLSSAWIDSTRCDRLVQALSEYRKRQIENITDPDGQPIYSDDPVHDWTSHFADALRTGACGFRPPRHSSDPMGSDGRRRILAPKLAIA